MLEAGLVHVNKACHVEMCMTLVLKDFCVENILGKFSGQLSGSMLTILLIVFFFKFLLWLCTFPSNDSCRPQPVVSPKIKIK